MAISTTSIPDTSNTLLTSTVASILGLKSTAATDTAAAKAATTQATGYDAEGNAYQTVSDVAEQNAVIARVAGDIKQIQEQRATNVTIGQQRAQVAAAGFKAAGSNLDILRSSLQQGYLTKQLTATQAELTAGGYLEEAAAAKSEKAATGVTSAAATAAASSYTAASALATANAANETAALNDFLGTKTLTSDQALILAPIKADVTKPTTLTTDPVTGAVTTSGTTTTTGTTTAPPTSVNPTIFSFKP